MESTNTSSREQLVNKINQNSIKTHFNIQLDSSRLHPYAEEEFHGSRSNHHHHHPKGRRTKRHRSDNEYSSSSTTATTQSNDNHDVISHVTAEDDDDIIDLANCLILLAQGIKPNTTTTTCLYECKTCNRVFSSFQALGGHRTSHTKPRPNSTPTVRSHPDHDDLTDDQDLSSSNNKTSTNNIRVHECSICGSEFPSGQALGGHMRRHRAPPLPAPLPDGRPIKIDGGGPRNVLPLDLNLPAPDDGEMINQEYMETKFHVLPTPTLVDCHY